MLTTAFSPAFIGGLGPLELIIILGIIILLFGASKIPSLMRSIGRGAVELKEGMEEAKEISAKKKHDKEIEDKKAKELAEPAKKEEEKKD